MLQINMFFIVMFSFYFMIFNYNYVPCAHLYYSNAAGYFNRYIVQCINLIVNKDLSCAS